MQLKCICKHHLLQKGMYFLLHTYTISVSAAFSVMVYRSDNKMYVADISVIFPITGPIICATLL